MQESNTTNSHESILKSTGIFGFTQLMKMVIGVVSAKFVAIFLGPVGIGVVGLLTNTINIITSVTSFGFNVTSIREVSLAQAENDRKILSERINFLQKWSILIGLFGFIITILFSPVFSKLTFGSIDKYHWFIFLSVNFLIISLTTSRIAILQGTRMLKQIALSNIVTSFLVSVIAIPIYYFLRFDGIIPVILLSSAIGLAVNYYYSRNVVSVKSNIPFSEVIAQGKPMMKLGFLLSINVVFGYVCTYIIKLYLNGNGSTVEILGFYEVSIVILLSYVGMIFNAMSTDFYPKLTSIQKDNLKVKELVNHQTEIALLILTPAIIALYFLSPIVIRLLYSKEFLGVLLIFKAALLSVIIKAIIWPLGFIILAKGNRKQYFKQELASDVLNIVFTIVAFHFFGLIGIGIATVLHYSIYGFYVYVIVKKQYDFSFTSETKKLMLQSLFLGLLASLTVFFFDYPFAYYPLGLLAVISMVISYFELNKRVDLYSVYLKIKGRIMK